MIENSQDRHPSSQAREFALQFLYQMEADRVYYFSISHLDLFMDHFEVPTKVRGPLRILLEGVFSKIDRIDDEIVKAAKNWSLERMSAIDRSMLRIATYEFLESDTPPKVILNEAIDLVKKYGSEQSGSFVNGILVTIGKGAGAEVLQ